MDMESCQSPANPVLLTAFLNWIGNISTGDLFEYVPIAAEDIGAGLEGSQSCGRAVGHPEM
jgi:hypothetical protein